MVVPPPLSPETGDPTIAGTQPKRHAVSIASSIPQPPVLNTFPDWMLYEYLYRQPELLAECMSTEFHEHRLIVDALAEHDQLLALRRTIEHMASRANELEAHLGISPEALREREAQVMPLLQAIQERALEKETV